MNQDFNPRAGLWALREAGFSTRQISNLVGGITAEEFERVIEGKWELPPFKQKPLFSKHRELYYFLPYNRYIEAYTEALRGFAKPFKPVSPAVIPQESPVGLASVPPGGDSGLSGAIHGSGTSGAVLPQKAP